MLFYACSRVSASLSSFPYPAHSHCLAVLGHVYQVLWRENDDDKAASPTAALGAAPLDAAPLDAAASSVGCQELCQHLGLTG